MKRVWLASLLLAVGCVTTTPEAERIVVTENPQATAGCKYLGRVVAWDTERRLKVEAAKLGANLVWLAPGRDVLRGEAYFCEQPTPAAK